MFLLGEYIKYKLISKGKYKIHSPFVFDFVGTCLEIPLQKEDSVRIKKLKSDLKKDEREITIQDFGAGSKKLGNRRKVKQIVRISASKGVYAKLLYQLNKHYSCKNVLEFGTSLGIGSIHFSLGNPKSKITSVDACLETQKIAQENAQKLKLSNINFIHSDFSSYIEKLSNEQFDLIFIDGHHDGKALLDYLGKLQKFAHEDTIFILDDIRWSNDMFEAWNMICRDEQFHLTMDLFRMGIVLRRPQQVKEHFVIKLKGILKGM